MLFQWLTRPFYALLRFIMHKEGPAMRVFSNATDATNASLLLTSLKENIYFLKDGVGNIIVTKVDYCKCQCGKGSPWEHEFLIVTLKESVGARRTAGLLVDRLIDDTKDYSGGSDELLADIARHQSEETVDIEATDSADLNSSAESESRALPPVQQWATSSPFQRSGAKFKRISKGDPPNALDRLVILPNLHRNAIAKELGNCAFDILMTMDLTQSQNHRSVALEHFSHLLRTTSRNTPQYHYIFAQCYWYAYTIWRILEIETQPCIVCKPELAERQCSYSGYGKSMVLGKGKFVNMVRSPETIRAQWAAERPAEDEEWAELKQSLYEDARREAENRRQVETALQESQARERELQRRVESLERSARSANAV
ncbi:hypothetical protein F5146DRAFT_1225918 [Armillaria mellea]|nr:hypothetical protein F5146DRAFT_1225918 [Armillaria mellea]